MNEIVQGSEAWFASRLGKVTGSRVADVIAKTKTGFGASRANYMAQLIAERLTGTQQDTYTNAAMQWGTEKEPDACAAYAFRTDAELTEVGFVDHPKIEMTGASPDRLVGKDGLLEVKSPNTSTHIDTLLGQSVAGKYITQIQWQLACTGRKYCDFVSFDPRMPEAMRLFIKRIPRDDAMIAELEKQVTVFLSELAQKERDLRNRYMPSNGLAA